MTAERPAEEGNGAEPAPAGLHETGLSAPVRDRHRALQSIIEELEAIDWYDQRIEATTDPDLADVLEHARDEEKEHAAMMIEVLRRWDRRLDEELRTHLFGGAARVDGAAREDAEAGDRADGSLGIGSLKEAAR